MRLLRAPHFARLMLSLTVALFVNQAFGQVVTRQAGGPSAASIASSQTIRLAQDCQELIGRLQSLVPPRYPGPSAPPAIQANYRQAMDAWKQQYAVIQQQVYQMTRFAAHLQADVQRACKEEPPNTCRNLQGNFDQANKCLAQAVAMTSGANPPVQTPFIPRQTGTPAQRGGLPTQ